MGRVRLSAIVAGAESTRINPASHLGKEASGYTMRQCFLPVVTGLLLLAIALSAAAQESATVQLPMPSARWTGDLDGMIERRVIRVLVAYSKTFYFVDQGTQRGTAYEGLKAFEEQINKKLKTGNLKIHVVFVPVPRDELLPGLIEGRGDIAAAGLTITPQREQIVDFTLPVFKGVGEIMVTGPESPRISSLDDLAGQEVFVRKSSSYYESLIALNRQFRERGKPEIVLNPADENLEDEDLLEMVNAGLVKIIFVDSFLAEFWKQILPDITPHPDLAVRTGGELAWAIRKNSPKLKSELDAFVKSHGRGTTFGNIILRRYLQSSRYAKGATSASEIRKFRELMALFQKYSAQYNMDWILMMAQGYQESRLDHTVKSSVGAIGVMQVMPATGKEMGVGDIARLEPNVHAGIKYIRRVVDLYYKDEPMNDLDKALFAFASYNAGPSRIKGLRKDARARGLNANVWFNNVEIVVAEKIGRETVQYVSNIYKYYIAYRLAYRHIGERETAKDVAADSLSGPGKTTAK